VSSVLAEIFTIEGDDEESALRLTMATSYQQYKSMPNNSLQSNSRVAAFGYRYAKAVCYAGAASVALLAVSAVFLEPEDTKLSVNEGNFLAEVVTEDGAVVKGCKETYGIFPCSTSFYGSFFLVLIYGAIITLAAQLIGDGGEALLELEVMPPSIIGGVLLPVLGVIPDAAIIAVSCLGAGSAETVQRKIAVGMGTLAGSTVMLLTIAYTGSLWLGRCDLDDKNRALDGILGGQSWKSGEADSIISVCAQGTSTGVTHDKGVLRIKWWMVATSCCYLIAQIPAGLFQDQALTRTACGAGAICCAGLLVLYLIDCVVVSQGEESENSDNHRLNRVEVKNETRNAEYLSKLAGLIHSDAISSSDIKDALEDVRADFRMSLRRVSNRSKSLTSHKQSTPMEIYDESGEVNREALDNIFDVFDVDKSGYLDEIETEKFVKVVFMSNGEVDIPKSLMSAIARARKHPPMPKPSGGCFPEEVKEPPGVINKEEFVTLVCEFMEESAAEAQKEADAEAEEAAQMSTDLHGDDEVSLFTAITMIILGTAFASAFSDALVDAIDSFGHFSGIPNFIIGFVVCPLASNASETISSFQLASRKKARNASVTFAQIYAACTMNNCACLGIFFFLVWQKNLGWAYAAEATSIVAVSWAVAFVTMCDTTIKTAVGWAVVVLYPLTLLYVEVLHRNGIR
jgi:Ca2+/Na+ antiporter